jgi:hypothetical protein
MQATTNFTKRIVQSFSGDTGLTFEQRKMYLDIVTQSVGGGGFYNQYQTFMRGIDRFQRNMVPPNVEHAGVTFITRPRLCLTQTSLRQQPEFAPLDTLDPTSIGFAMRCLLDTKFTKDNLTVAAESPLLNIHSPFFTPLINGLKGISGFPDPVLQTLTTDAGFHSEDQTFAIGYDQLFKSYDLSLTFKDIQNGPISALFFFWLLYMGYVTKGMMPAYKDDIYRQRMNYTVSIYRFMLDPSRKYVTRYSKATGCFPKSVPFGSMFNYSEAELYNPEVGKFTIPFVTNRVEYNRYPILMDFNMLVNRYRSTNRQIKQWTNLDDILLTTDVSENYEGVPWIDTSTGRIRLLFLK